jgi:pyrroloquinoline quinone biosynthesis protein B
VELQLPQLLRVRRGSLRALARTQSSIVISSDGLRSVPCNVSPDLHRQIAATPRFSRGRACVTCRMRDAIQLRFGFDHE